MQELYAGPARAALAPLHRLMESRLLSADAFGPKEVLGVLKSVLSETSVYKQQARLRTTDVYE